MSFSSVKLHRSKVKTDAEITIKGADISARDNAAPAAASTITAAFGDLRNRGLIDDAELKNRLSFLRGCGR
jgi:hypothetical protein